MKKVIPFALAVMILAGCGETTENETQIEQENTAVEAASEISLEEKTEEKTEIKEDNSTQADSEDNGITGTWKSYASEDNSIDFMEDGRVIMYAAEDVTEATYSIQEEKIIIESDGKEVMSFQFNPGGIVASTTHEVYWRESKTPISRTSVASSENSANESKKQEEDKKEVKKEEKNTGIIGKWYPEWSDFKVYYMQIDEGGTGSIHRDDQVISITYTYDGKIVKVKDEYGGSNEYYYYEEDDELVSDFDGDVYTKEDKKEEILNTPVELSSDDIVGTWYDPTRLSTGSFTFNADGTGVLDWGSGSTTAMSLV